MKKKHIIIIAFFLVIIFLVLTKEKDSNVDFDEISQDFYNEEKVAIVGYEDDAMEPYISRDGKYLFFNNHKGERNKDIYYAKKIDDKTFEFKGEVLGVNTSYVDGNPTMDAQNNFYFITTRDLDFGDSKTIYSGIFNNGEVTNLKKVAGSINIKKRQWINMGVEITGNGQLMYTSNAYFKFGDNFPSDGDIRFALRERGEFNIPENEQEILKNINTDNAVEYAGEVSRDGLELFYSQVSFLKDGLVFKLYQSKRDSVEESFGVPKLITEPFKNNIKAFVEAPTLSHDGQNLYYHKLENGIFSIFKLSRKQEGTKF